MTQIALRVIQAACEAQMQIEVCNGCDACGLRCADDVPANREEWQTLQAYIAQMSTEQRAELDGVMAQDKSVDLGDEVSVSLCQYRDRKGGRCMVYPARPLVCRLLGHVEWMPCPIQKVPRPIPTPDALDLMRAYALTERRTFVDWERNEPG